MKRLKFWCKWQVSKQFYILFFFKGYAFFFFFLILFLAAYVICFSLFWLRLVFVAALGLSLVAVGRGHSSLQCMGFSLRWPLLLRSTGSRHAVSAVVARRLQSAGSAAVVHGLHCSVACGIFLDQGSNPCLLHWQVDS